MDVQETAVQSDRVFTVPNLLSSLRLLGVPLFLWLILGPKADGWAVAVLIIAGFTDYLDGKLARRWHQITRLGQLLDPIADRLYILATLVGLLLREIVPWWIVALLVGRDLILAAYMWALKRHGVTGLPVHLIGKAATFCLLYAFPLILLGQGPDAFGEAVRPIGWAFAYWGIGLYWWAAVLYIKQAHQILRSGVLLPPT